MSCRYSPESLILYQVTVYVVAAVVAFALHRYYHKIRFGWIAWGAAVGCALTLTPDDEWLRHVRITDSLNFDIDALGYPIIWILLGIIVDLFHDPPERLQFGIKQLLLLVAIFATLTGIFVSYFKQPALP
jgi:hypothetical protein